MRMLTRLTAASLIALTLSPALAQAQAPDLQTTKSSLTFREIGPALMGGRTSSLAVV